MSTNLFTENKNCSAKKLHELAEKRKKLVELLERRAGEFQSEKVRRKFVATHVGWNEDDINFVLSKADAHIARENMKMVLGIFETAATDSERSEIQDTDSLLPLERILSTSKNIREIVHSKSFCERLKQIYFTGSDEGYRIVPTRTEVADETDVTRRVLKKLHFESRTKKMKDYS